ncbi:MAG: hypothetical protein R3C59_17060 [Planctomycetaceae bacterium]
MSTLGKVCLVLTLLLMLLAMAPIPSPWGGWTPRLLVIHNQWSEKLRDAKKKAGDAILAHRQARQELELVTANVKGVTLGWDRYWTVPARGQNADPTTPTIARQNDHLFVRNIALEKPAFTDDSNQNQFADPIVHAFYGGPEGFTYAGEFRAINVAPQQAELEPVHALEPGEADAWDVNATWRLRMMIPAGLRASVDDLYHHKRRTFELAEQTRTNIQRQRDLQTAAQEALAVRQGELLGNPAGPDIPQSPEFKLGLLKVNEDVEEERNQLLLELDALRREINLAVQERSNRLEKMQQRVSRLPGSKSQFAKASGQAGSAE